ncbi:MAG: polysaccharide biosynthesis protein [Gammaproteobacteria bacterium]
MGILTGKRLLITGGTGSMGRVLVRRLLTGEMGEPEKIIVFSRDEGKQHAMRLAYMHQGPATDEVIYNNFRQRIEFRVGNVSNYVDIANVITDVDVVIHAAALKQVPTCEYFPHQALLTNCEGAVNVVNAIKQLKAPVELLVGISTDKACKPVNVMGMTKAIQERIFTSSNISLPNTRSLCVRYGNVIASRGSVIPLFIEQIRQGSAITITHPKMTRFLMSIDEAVDTVFAAIRHGEPGDTLIPIAPSSTVFNIAKALIGERSIPIKDIGVRPGEKMHEILISEEEIHHLRRIDNYYVINPMLPELKRQTTAPSKLLKREFSSEDYVLTLDETRDLLQRHGILSSEGHIHSSPSQEDALIV